MELKAPKNWKKTPGLQDCGAKPSQKPLKKNAYRSRKILSAVSQGNVLFRDIYNVAYGANSFKDEMAFSVLLGRLCVRGFLIRKKVWVPKLHRKCYVYRCTDAGYETVYGNIEAMDWRPNEMIPEDFYV